MFKKYLIKIKKILQTKKEFFLLIGIILVGLGLRLINIGIEPYWSDEILGIEIAKYYLGDLNGLWNYLQLVEVHPPLYYYLIQLWGNLFGFAEAGIRSLSLIFSLGLIALTYYAGITLFNSKKIGLMAAFITAVLPMQIEYGQEARPYAIYCFFGVLSLILLAKYFKEKITKKKIGLIIGFILCNIIGLYLHYSYMLILIPLFIYWLIKLILNKSSREFIWWLSAMTVIFLGFYPWLPALIFKSFLMDDVVVTGQRSVYNTRPFLFFEKAFNSLIWTNKSTLNILEIITAILIKIMLAGLIIKIILKNQCWIKKYKKNLIYLGLIFIMSITIFLIFPSSANYTDLLYRHIIFDSIILSLLLGVIFIQIKNIRWRIICISLFVISLLTFQIKIVSDDSLYDINYNFKTIVNYINEQYKDGDMLIANAAFVRPQLNYYLKNGLPEFIGVFPTYLMIPDFMQTKKTLGMLENEAQLRYLLIEWPGMDREINYLIKKNNAQRVWVFGEGPQMQIRKWFTFNGWRIGFEPIGDIFPLTLYIKK